MTKICPRCNKGAKHFTEWTCRLEEPNAIPYELFGEVTATPDEPKLTPKQKQERKILKLQEQLAREIKILAGM
ncbi:hypothetical protein [Vibrio parahaemolyticus]|uniref:hypothetical protein n=1 Tax=Vibrio parahaemolyticus TaxID=670 RepID=UPI00226B9918|nr:hypothetical protein [Vibrio parahaemolyticus]MCX8941283.1 hypothetical protein [Vibrio parahaemolyticus]